MATRQRSQVGCGVRAVGGLELAGNPSVANSSQPVNQRSCYSILITNKRPRERCPQVLSALEFGYGG